ncbi:MAG: Flavoprotein [Bacteroidota bacterium]|nr:Flavoprotein [Bacteroidota bacterium]
MKSEILFDNGRHKWVVFGRDPERKKEVIDTNQYVIIHDEQAILLDPGGIEIFPQVITELSKYVKTENIKAILSSHQDPDISSSLSMWFDMCSELKVYCSWLWTGFLSHFGMGTSLKLMPIPDDGMELNIGTTNSAVYFVPAHYCHSSGNFICFDPITNFLFTGDLGAALLPDDETDMFVKNFESHIKYMELFHKRWLPSNNAKNILIKKIREINPDMLCPQHGSIFKGADTVRFLDWLENLDVGNLVFENEGSDYSNAPWMKWKK